VAGPGIATRLGVLVALRIAQPVRLGVQKRVQRLFNRAANDTIQMPLDPFVIDPDHIVERSRNRRILTHGGFLLSLFGLTSQSPEEPESGPPAFNQLCEKNRTSSSNGSAQRGMTS
jgi:hypothetical protein